MFEGFVGPRLGTTNTDLNVLQVKGQRKYQKTQRLKIEEQKVTVDVRREMTAAELAAAMNKDFGKNGQNRSVFFMTQ